MYIQPNTNIRILRNVPCDVDYTNTLWFNSLSDQTSYFIGQTKHNLGSQYFVRISNGVARVEVPIGDLYDCNYLMFQNTSFSNKWFYAFITNIEYVNNVTSEITFELDAMQSWFFDYTMQDVFVEREHTLTDNIGDNIVPESFNLGEYVTNEYERLMNSNDVYIVIAYIPIDNAQTGGQIIDGVFQGCNLRIYPSTPAGVNNINTFLTTYLEKPDNIQAIYTIPSWAYGGTPADTGTILPFGATGFTNSITANPVNVLNTLDGYKPRNRKLYTYPFNFYQIDNASGQSLALRYEFFENLTPQLINFSSITQPVISVIRPTGYKNTRAGDGSLISPQSLNTETLTLSNFPQCSWVVDSYDAWSAQQALPLAIGTGGAIATLGMSGMGESKSTLPIIGAIGAIGNAFLQQYQASIRADICRGILSSGNANISYGTQNFFGGRFSIEHSMARQIDDYFDMFGYAIREVKKPNRNYRPHWNYVKTIDCQINASFPYVYEQQINNIYNNGIRFWRNPSEVGDYSLDNSPI